MLSVTAHHPSSLLHQWSSVIRDLRIIVCGVCWMNGWLGGWLFGLPPPSGTVPSSITHRVAYPLPICDHPPSVFIRDRPSSIITSSPMVIRYP
jgi:hypothetical protein